MGAEQIECLLSKTSAKVTVRMIENCEMLIVCLELGFCRYFLGSSDSTLPHVTDSCRRVQEARKALRPEDLLDRGGAV